MSRRPMIRRLSLTVAAAASVVALLSGCGAISGLLGGETRDESGAIVEGGSTDVFTLAEGDCIDDDSTDEGATEISDVPTVPCDEPHTWEVYANVTMDGDEYPGDVEVTDYADEQCLAEFEGFVGVSYEDSVHEYNYYTPTSEGWDMGDRTINCLIGGVEQTTGSLSGAAE